MGAYMIYQDYTAGTPVTPLVTTIPQVIKTWTLDASDADNIIVRAVFRITTTTATTPAQTLPLVLTIGSNTMTYNLITTVSTKDDKYVTAQLSSIGTSAASGVGGQGLSRAGDVVTAQLNGGLIADTTCVVNVVAFEIYEMSY